MRIFLPAFLIGLMAPSAAHAYGNNQDVSFTVDIDSNSGWFDDWIWNHDASTVAQTRCPKLAFVPSAGFQYNTWATGNAWAPGPGQPPIGGVKVLTHCYYTVTFQMPAYQPYTIDVYPICSGTSANVPPSYRLARVGATAGNSFSGTQYLSAVALAPYRWKSYWRGVISQCGGNTSYYDNNHQLAFQAGGQNYYADWY